MEITSKKLKKSEISRYKSQINMVMNDSGTKNLKYFSYYNGMTTEHFNNILDKPKNSVLHFGMILNGIFTNILKTLEKDNIEECNKLYNEVSNKLFQQLIENKKIIANPNTVEDKDFFRKKLVLGEYDEYLKDVFKELQIIDINEQQKYFKYVFYIKILELIQLSENLLINIFEEEKPILDKSYEQLGLLLNNFFTELEGNKLTSNEDDVNLTNIIIIAMFKFLVNKDLSNYIKYFIKDIFEEKNTELMEFIKDDEVIPEIQEDIIKYFQEKLDVFNEVRYNEFNLTRTFDSLFEIISDKDLSTNISFVDIIEGCLKEEELLYCIKVFVIDNFDVLKLKCQKIIENGQIAQETKERYTEFLKTKLEGVNAYSKTKCSLKEFFTQLSMYDLSANLDSKTLGVLFDAVKILVKDDNLKDYIKHYVKGSFDEVEKEPKPEIFKETMVNNNELFSQVFVHIMCDFVLYGMKNEYQNSIHDSLNQAFSAFDSVKQGIGK